MKRFLLFIYAFTFQMFKHLNQQFMILPASITLILPSKVCVFLEYNENVPTPSRGFHLSFEFWFLTVASLFRPDGVACI